MNEEKNTMKSRTIQIDMVELLKCLLRRSWIMVLCAIIGFAAIYWRFSSRQQVTYTASGTMYVYNGNPNMINYQYTSIADLNSAVQLLDTYMVVVKSNKVMNAVAERLSADYPGIQPNYIASTLSMGSVSETGVLRVSCVTDNPQKSADICNAVMDVAPAEIKRVVSAGGIEVIDYAEPPVRADSKSVLKQSLIGALAGLLLSGAVLVLLFLINSRILTVKELSDRYTPPVLASVRRDKAESEDPRKFLMNDQSPMEIVESYAKLRMNLLYTLVGKDSKLVVVTSALSGEGKSTMAANLAISCATSGKKVLLIDGDMRRCTQREIFRYEREKPGLSDILIGAAKWEDTLIQTDLETLQILPAGHTPPNPAELLSTQVTRDLLAALSGQYDLILMDAPPVNIVSDPLTLSDAAAGCLFVIRQFFSDHCEVRKALHAAEMTGMNVLGFIFYGEKLQQSSHYNQRYYKEYYHQQANRVKTASNKTAAVGRNEHG